MEPVLAGTAAVTVVARGERDTTDWPEPAHEGADRQQGIQWKAAGRPRAASASFSNCKIRCRQSRT